MAKDAFLAWQEPALEVDGIDLFEEAFEKSLERLGKPAAVAKARSDLVEVPVEYLVFELVAKVVK